MAGPAGEKLETILVVDDNRDVLSLVASILESVNYNVLQSGSGSAAIEFAASYPGKIDLLLSDVQMPEMSGPALGTALKLSRPDLRVMLMSGMGDGSLLVLNYGWAFIEKPFMLKTLLAMVDVVLHTPDRSQESTRFDTRRDTKAHE